MAPRLEGAKAQVVEDGHGHAAQEKGGDLPRDEADREALEDAVKENHPAPAMTAAAVKSMGRKRTEGGARRPHGDLGSGAAFLSTPGPPPKYG